MLFNEIYSSYYLAVSSILREAVRCRLTGTKLSEIVRDNAFCESFIAIMNGLRCEKWQLMRHDFSTNITNEPDLPLSILEKRWLKSLLSDPRIKLFSPDTSGLDDIEPLFDYKNVVYYDRYTDGDDYNDSEYIEHFRLILKSMREKRNLHIIFETRLHECRDITVTPHHLEYSSKDDRFRLVCSGASQKNDSFRWTINISRIVECEVSDEDEHHALPEKIMERVTFELSDQWNAMERVLLHFSHLQRETKRIGDKRYLVRLWYDKDDETEILIRILSFGSAIRVTEPERFIERLKERIRKQKEFATFLPR